MAKKFVRGITDVKTINNQDFDTNNVNDLLSDGQYNYIHRKKGKNEEYHNLTDNIKTLSSDNTDLLTVTNNNKTTNTATLHPKHDAQKEQVLESTRNTVNIQHGTNGTAEKTTVDTNPQKVLEHEKLKTGDGLTTSFNTDETTIRFKATKKPRETNLNTLGEGVIYGKGFSIDQVPGGYQDLSAAYVTISIDENTKVQFYIREQTNDYGVIRLYYRFIINGEVTEWRKMPGDRSDLNYELAQKEQVLESQNNTITINHGTNRTDEKTTVNTNPEKVLEHENLISDSEYITLDHQTDVNKTHIKTESLKQELQQLHQTKQDTLTSNTSIGVSSNNTLRQVIMYLKTYTVQEGSLRVWIKDVSRVGSLDNREEEFNFVLKIKKATSSISFKLETADVTRFTSIMTKYGENNSLTINGCSFQLSGSTLTVSPTQTSEKNQVITFSDVI